MTQIVCPEQLENHSKVSAVVVESLKKYIKDNELKENDRLPSEWELCKLLHVSRASIREAMGTLESSGIIYSVQGKGRFIQSFNYNQMMEAMSFNLNIHFKDFGEIVQIRKALEMFFLPKIMSQYTEGDFEQLESILEEMNDQMQKGASYKELSSLHTFFHKTLYKRLNNKLLESLISMFSSYQRMTPSPEQDNELFICQHEELLQCLKEEDEEKLKLNLEQHFKDFE